VDSVQFVFSNEMAFVQSRFLTAIVAVVGMFSLSPKFASLIVVAVPALAMVLSGLGERYVYPLQQVARLESTKLAQVVGESFTHIKVVKAFGMEVFCEHRFEAPLQARLAAERKASWVTQGFEGLIFFMCGCFLYMGIRLGRQLLSAQDLLSTLAFAAQFGIALVG